MDTRAWARCAGPVDYGADVNIEKYKKNAKAGIHPVDNPHKKSKSK